MNYNLAPRSFVTEVVSQRNRQRHDPLMVQTSAGLPKNVNFMTDKFSWQHAQNSLTPKGVKGGLSLGLMGVRGLPEASLTL